MYANVFLAEIWSRGPKGECSVWYTALLSVLAFGGDKDSDRRRSASYLDVRVFEMER